MLIIELIAAKGATIIKIILNKKKNAYKNIIVKFNSNNLWVNDGLTSFSVTIARNRNQSFG